VTTATVERWLSPLDRVRTRTYRALGRLGTPFVRQRELRVAALGSTVVVSSFAATLGAPLWLLALGPIVWGTPHLLGDLRYMVVRPGYHRRRWLWLVAGAPLAATAAGGGVLFGLLATAGALAVARGSLSRRAAGLGVVAALAIAMHAMGPVRDIVFAHAHNFVAVAIWLAWRRRSGRAHLAVLALLVMGTVLIAGGSADRWIFESGVLSLAPVDLDLGAYFWELTPGVRGPMAMRLVLLFAFAQAVHYGVWIRLIPEDDRARETPRTFAATYRALENDFGRVVLWLVALSALFFAFWAVLDLAEARASYLRFALFHGHLELAAFALFWAESKERR
jgi:hypothetical protein